MSKKTQIGPIFMLYADYFQPDSPSIFNLTEKTKTRSAFNNLFDVFFVQGNISLQSACCIFLLPFSLSAMKRKKWLPETGKRTPPFFSNHPSFSQRTIAKNKRTRTTNKPRSIQRQKILAYALQNNRALSAFRARVKRAKAALRGARVFPNNPTLAAGGGPQLPVNSTVTSGQPSSILPRVGVDLSLALPIGGRWGKTQHLASSRLQWFQHQIQFQTFRLSTPNPGKLRGYGTKYGTERK